MAGSTPAGKKSGPRLVDAMPRPLLVLFVLGGLAAMGTAVLLLIRPPRFDSVALEQRRPPPRGTYSHDAVEVFPVPLPSVVPPYDPPCPAVAETKPQAGTGGLFRLREVLRLVCTMTGPGVPDEIHDAIRGLRGATIRAAEFRRTGTESTVDFSTKTIWFNVKFAARDLRVSAVVPVLLHEAWHLAHADRAVTAPSELDARRLEVAVCRQLIRIDDWPRWCEDARRLTVMPQAPALDLLARAGYPS